MLFTKLLKLLRNMSLVVLLLHAGTNNLFAQQDTDQQLPVSLNEAIEIALVNSYVLQRSNLSIEEANKQILQAWGTVYPQIGGTTSYTRNVKTPNPFAGSDAEGLFSSFAALGWLAYNENQRQNNNPTLSFEDYNQNVSDGYDAAGIQVRSSDNPFAIENQFIMGVSATQAIYNGAAFAAIRGAEQLRQIVKNQLERDTQTMVNEVRTAYLRALLANEQVKLLESSLEQLKETKGEISALVDQGLLSRFDRNSLEVEIVNLETNLIAAQNGAALATRSINIVLGIPTYIDLRLTDSFENYSLKLPEISKREEAFEIALQRRADLRQADGAIRFREAERELIRATYFPIVNAFANYAYIGNVPDNRTQVRPVQNQDFTFTSTERSFFNDSYWNASFAVGLRLQWSIFNGFQTRARMQQVAVNIKRAELDALMLRESVYLQVDASLRNVESSWLRIQSQKRNIELAELNYSDAKSRLREGIGTRLEERQASSLLDQSRLNYLAAIHDYLVAKSEYDTALGLRTVEIQITD
jgi:outer membrane protein TolC